MNEVSPSTIVAVGPALSEGTGMPGEDMGPERIGRT